MPPTSRPDWWSRAVELYRAGVGTPTIAKELRKYQGSVRHALRRSGVILRDRRAAAFLARDQGRGRKRPKWWDEAARLHANGATTGQIGRALGYSALTVWRAMRVLGVNRPRSAHSQPGGRTRPGSTRVASRPKRWVGGLVGRGARCLASGGRYGHRAVVDQSRGAMAPVLAARDRQR